MSTIADGLWNAFLMGWEVWWALVLGFLISAMVQSWVPRERIEGALAGRGPRSIAWATGAGAASSSCSYAAVAIAKSLFQKGASAASALAFQFASTNLVWELGLVLWVLIGWQFTLAEFVGGLVMIALMAAMLRLFVSPRQEEQARSHALRADTGHQHHMAGEGMPLRERLTSPLASSDVAHNFRGDWQMLVMLFGAMLDIGIVQNPMFGSGKPPGWGVVLPAYGPGRIVIDGGFSAGSHAWGAFAIAVGWTLALGVLVAALLARMVGTAKAA